MNALTITRQAILEKIANIPITNYLKRKVVAILDKIETTTTH